MALARWAVVVPSTAYVLWVSASVIAWVSHLGARVPALAPWLAAGGAPAMWRASGLVDVARSNLPSAAAFLLPHSLLRPARLEKVLGSWGRLAYNVAAAASLHWFMASFVPHDSPIVCELPLPAGLHAALSIAALVAAYWALLADVRTWALLGAAQALYPGAAVASPPPRMDLITWQGICVHARFGPIGFALFSGLSILPRAVTASDVAVRLAAASYLRALSPSFRTWLRQVEAVHLCTWAARAVLVLFAIGAAARASGGGAAPADLTADASRASTAVLISTGVLATLTLRRLEGRGRR